MRHLSFCFLIIERDCFIAQDMREGLSEACGICGCRRYPAIEELLAQEDELRALAQLPVIITKKSLADADAEGLTALAQRNGWPVVVRLDLDPAEAVQARGWLTLPSPFTRLDLTVMVEELRARFPHLSLRRA